MTTPLLLSLLLVQGPSGSAPPPELSGEPMLAPGIVVSQPSAARATFAAGPSTDAWGCLEGVVVCRHQAVVVEDGEYQPGRPGVPTVNWSFSNASYGSFSPMMLRGSHLFPPDCDTYADCRMLYEQYLQNLEVTQQIRVRKVRSEAMSAQYDAQHPPKSRAGGSATEVGGGTARFGPQPARAPGGQSMGGGSVSHSGGTGGGTSYSTSTSSAGGGRTGTAKER